MKANFVDLKAAKPKGLYIHFPFCASLCAYCDFASEIYSASRVQAYLAALEKEFLTRSAPFRPLRFRTIYLGGGTPSSLSPAELNRFFAILQNQFEISNEVEFTIEANPGTIDLAKLELLRGQGVNRISFGVQSFQPRLLKLLGRRHSAAQSCEAVQLARRAGFGNISIDLLHGMPGQTLAELHSDLDETLALQIEHVSAYGLTYEDGTPLAEAVKSGTVRKLPAEKEGELYLAVMEGLERGGLAQYEISNYARPGREAQHNLIYWHNEAYLGLGVAAASFINWERSCNRQDFDGYLQAIMDKGEASATRETLEPAARAREALILELRLRRGVDRAEFAERWGLDGLANQAAEDFLSAGLLEKLPSGRIRLSRRGLLVADSVLCELV
jgi:oxygen-independent coproporphyrinogen-3 oxidase